MRIVSLDTGKFKTVADMYDTQDNQGRFETVATTPQALHDLLVRECPDRVVLEISPLAGWIHDLAGSLGIASQVVNVAGAAWKYKNVKNKSDQGDARKLSVLSAMGQVELVYMPKKGVRQWRGVIGYRQALVGERTRIRNRIRARLSELGMGWPWGQCGWTRRAIAALGKLALPLEKCVAEDLWRGQLDIELQRMGDLDRHIRAVEDKLEALAQKDRRVALLRTIPGVGPRLAEVIVSIIDDPHRFRNGRQVGAYAGLTPRQHQSGEMDRQGRISGAGSGLLRALLVEVGWLGQRYNPWLKGVFDGVCRGSKARRKIAVVATARRLLIVAWAMLRDDRPWEQTGPGMAQAA